MQEVEDDADLEILPPRVELKRRPYWRADSPTLYQLSNVAFPFKWIHKKNGELTKEELMDIELGEAVNSGWWHEHGPGQRRGNS